MSIKITTVQAQSGLIPPPDAAQHGGVFSHFFYGDIGKTIYDRYLESTGFANNTVQEKKVTYNYDQAETDNYNKLKLNVESEKKIYTSPDLPANYRLILSVSSESGYEVSDPTPICICYLANNHEDPTSEWFLNGPTDKQFYRPSLPSNNINNPYVHDVSAYIEDIRGRFNGQPKLQVPLTAPEHVIRIHASESDKAPLDPYFFHPYDYRYLYHRSSTSGDNIFSYIGKVHMQGSTAKDDTDAPLAGNPSFMMADAWCSTSSCVASKMDNDGRRSFMDLDFDFLGGLWDQKISSQPIFYMNEWFKERYEFLHTSLEHAELINIPVTGTVSGVDWQNGGRIRVAAMAGQLNSGSGLFEGQDDTNAIQWTDTPALSAPGKISVAKNYTRDITIYACVRKGDQNFEGSVVIPNADVVSKSKIDFGELKLSPNPTKCQIDILEGTITSQGGDFKPKNPITDAIIDALKAVGGIIQNFIVYVVSWAITLASNAVPI